MSELVEFLVGLYLICGGIFILFLLIVGFNVIFDTEKRKNDRST